MESLTSTDCSCRLNPQGGIVLISTRLLSETAVVVCDVTNEFFAFNLLFPELMIPDCILDYSLIFSKNFLQKMDFLSAALMHKLYV